MKLYRQIKMFYRDIDPLPTSKLPKKMKLLIKEAFNIYAEANNNTMCVHIS